MSKQIETSNNTLLKFQVQTQSLFEFSNPAMATVKRQGNKLIFTVEYFSNTVAKSILSIIQQYEKHTLDEHTARIKDTPYLDSSILDQIKKHLKDKQDELKLGQGFEVRARNE